MAVSPGKTASPRTKPLDSLRESKGVRAGRGGARASTMSREPSHANDRLAKVREEVTKDFALRPLRSQLLLVYGGSSTLVFCVMIGLCVGLVYSTASTAKDTARRELMDQVASNDAVILSDASQVLTETFIAGGRALALPFAMALFDIHTTVPTYSLVPTPGYADENVSFLAEPLTRHQRYHCNPSSSPAEVRARGCDSEGLALISTEASSVYLAGTTSLTGFLSDASNVDAVMTNNDVDVDRTSILDVFVTSAWSASTAWLDVFYAQPLIRETPLTSNSLFLQYPGAPGSLQANSAGVRTYEPTTRPFYKDAAASAVLGVARSRSSFLSVPATTISPPYLDAFGRG